MVNSPVRADLNFGHVDAVEETVDDLDEEINNREGEGSGSGCSVNYGPWLSGINSMADLDEQLLEVDLDTAPKLDVIGNNRFSEDDTEDSPSVDHELRPDTMLQRCNTTFGDTGNPDYTHRIFCRGFRLPDGKQYDNFSELQVDANSPPTDLATLSFFHAGNIDDDSENWLFPLIDQYKNQCRSRPTHVILFGAYVYKDVMGDSDRRVFDGNKWHLTSVDWAGTVLEDVMDQSELVVTGHVTAGCPFDDVDTRGLYVGGQSEAEGRRITNRVGSNALWVGAGADTPTQNKCFSGIDSDNPANASVPSGGAGIQLEYQVTTSDPVPFEDVARAVLGEF